MSEVIPILISKDDGRGNFVKAEEVQIEKVGQEIVNTLTCHETGFSVHHSNMCIVAMRGRNPENPSDRTPEIHTEQRLEPNSEGICNTLTTVQKDNLVLEQETMASNCEVVKIEKVGQISNEGSQCGTVVSTNGLYPTISAGCHGYANPHILEKNTDVIIYDDYNSNVPENQDCIGTLTTNIGSSTIRNGIKLVEKNNFYEQAIKTAEENNAQEGDIVDAFNRKVLKEGISPTVTTRPEGKKTAILPVVEKYRIRKLTPRECWRLMGFTDEDFEKAAMVNSNSQLYKQAGNSIVKNVLMAIFNKMVVTA